MSKGATTEARAECKEAASQNDEDGYTLPCICNNIAKSRGGHRDLNYSITHNCIASLDTLTSHYRSAVSFTAGDRFCCVCCSCARYLLFSFSPLQLCIDWSFSQYNTTSCCSLMVFQMHRTSEKVQISIRPAMYMTNVLFDAAQAIVDSEDTDLVSTFWDNDFLLFFSILLPPPSYPLLILFTRNHHRTSG